MTDTTLLREKIDNSGYKLRYLAERCGITYQAFLNRMQGEIEFRMNEVRELKELLQLQPDEVDRIFFLADVNENSTK